MIPEAWVQINNLCVTPCKVAVKGGEISVAAFRMSVRNFERNRKGINPYIADGTIAVIFIIMPLPVKIEELMESEANIAMHSVNSVPIN